ncbi:MAG: cyclic nucleotide-binding domain-containing protein [Nitrospirae bacterium]|nr:cyclic nucleotide-binding domain-containing protein [Nitrospirota bacterium]
MDKNSFSYLMRQLYEEISSADVDEAYETFMLILDLVFIDKANVPRFFQELLDKDTLRMFDDISLAKFKSNETICKEGDHDYSMFIIVSGTVRISKKNAKSKGPIVPLPPVLLNHLITSLLTGGAKTISHLSVGDFFGESALFSSKPMAVTATAETDVEAMVITGKSLQKAMTVKPNLRSLLREYYVTRLDSMVEFLHKEQGLVQACAFGALIGKMMPDGNNHYSDTSMMFRAEEAESGDALQFERNFSLNPKSTIETGLMKVMTLCAKNRKADAAILYLSLSRLFFKDIAAVAVDKFTHIVMNNPKVKNITILYNALDKLQHLIPVKTPELPDVDEPDYHRNFMALFNDLLKRKLDKAKELHLKQGQTVVKLGDKSDSIFIVRAGSIKVYPHGISPGDEEQEGKISTIGKGEIYGELDFFNKKPRTATVIAAEAETSLYELKRPLVTEIVKEYPEVLEFFKRAYKCGISTLIKEADAIRAYYKNDLMADVMP